MLLDNGGGEFDKIDVEDVDEFLGMIEWKADPLFPVVIGAAEEIGLELGGFGDEAGDPVDPTLGGGGGNEYGEKRWDWRRRSDELSNGCDAGVAVWAAAWAACAALSWA